MNEYFVLLVAMTRTRHSEFLNDKMHNIYLFCSLFSHEIKSWALCNTFSFQSNNRGIPVFVRLLFNCSTLSLLFYSLSCLQGMSRWWWRLHVVAVCVRRHREVILMGLNWFNEQYSHIHNEWVCVFVCKFCPKYAAKEKIIFKMQPILTWRRDVVRAWR